jgi:serine/threonine protein kinase
LTVSSEVKNCSATSLILSLEAPAHGRDERSECSLFYQMLSGSMPTDFADGNVYRFIKNALTEPPRPLREANPDVPEAVEAIVMRTLAKHPNERPTASELAAEFAAASGVRRDRLARATRSAVEPSDRASGSDGLGNALRIVTTTELPTVVIPRHDAFCQ